MLFFILCLLGDVHGHMGVSKVCNQAAVCIPANNGISPAREQPVVGDAYRYPNAGHCHGVLPQAATTTFAVGDTVKVDMSSGAAHNGGHCALFLARKSDNEGKWFKQMDNIDCTTTGTFSWTIDAALVPTECKDGCALIWVWNPTSSGACEIYMNCFDLIISGNNGGVAPAAAYTIDKNPACQRVNNEKKTASFGEFCGTSCAKGGAAAPTALPAAPSAAPPTAKKEGCTNCRCGRSWTDANGNCDRPTCTIENESINCQSDTKCFADMVNICANSPTSMSVPVVRTKCAAIGVWASDKSIHAWCATNCPAVCPASHCKCGTVASFVEEAATNYNPTCQVHTTTDPAKSIINITNDYDLSAYQTILTPGQAGIDEATLVAAEELLQFNRGCGAVQVRDIYEALPEGEVVYITGDCQLTNDCPQPQSDAHQKCSHLLSLFIAMFVCLAFAL